MHTHFNLKDTSAHSPYAQGARIWLIGASAGIGKELALQWAQQGAQLIISGRSEDELQALHAELPTTFTAAGGATRTLTHHVQVADVTDITALENAAHYIAAHTQNSKPLMVFYNAGAYSPAKAVQWEAAALLTQVEVNLLGPLYAVQAALPMLKEAATRGAPAHLVFNASVAGFTPLPAGQPYGATKAGLQHLASALNIELAPENINVRIINHGFVKTRLTQQNNFPMPFLMEASEAAQHIITSLAKKGYEVHFPKKLSLPLKWMAHLPQSLKRRLLKKVNA